MELFEELEQEGIDRGLLEAIRAFRAEHPVPQEAQGRLIRPKLLYYGREVWQAAATALLCGENLLLSGPKATGKNVLAENLAAAFGRPVWNMSMYVNIDAASLIGADTLKEGEVVFREGPVCQCARLGGFGVLDEVNLAKNEALAVLHAALDFRRVLDVPGYRPVPLDDAARFIGTMNYGYAGTRELNEALVSLNTIVGLAQREGWQETLEPLLRSFEGSTRGALYSDLLWMGLERCLALRWQEERPALQALRRDYAAQALARLPAPQDRNEGESLRGCWWARALDQPHRESSREKAVLDQLEFPQTWSGDQVRQEVVRLPGVSFLAQTVSRLIQGRLTAGDRL